MADPVTDALGFAGKREERKAATHAANIQASAADQGIAAQKEALEESRAILDPYVQGGREALYGDSGASSYIQAGALAGQKQRDIAGLNGPEAQQLAYQEIESDPLYSGMMQQGEDAILQNAAATGGLRGGNTQAALAQFRPELLRQQIQDKYARLGGLAGTGLGTAMQVGQMGQASAAGQASAGLQTGQSVAGLMGNRGAALASSAAIPNNFGLLMNTMHQSKKEDEAALYGAGTGFFSGLGGGMGSMMGGL